MIKSVKIRLLTITTGFSLLEILVVVLLLAVFSGLAIPNFANSYRRFIVRQTSGDLVYLMQYVQSQAILKHGKYTLWIDPDQGQYGIAQNDKPIPGRMGRVHQTPSGIVFQNAIRDIDFYPDGKIESFQFDVCYSSECLTISSQEQMGHVEILNHTS